MNETLIVAEHDGIELAPVTRDLIAWGTRLATVADGKVSVLLAGFGMERIAESLSGLTDTLYLVDDPVLEQYNPALYAKVIIGTMSAGTPRLVLLGHSYQGIELSSALGAQLNATLWSNCLTIERIEEGYEVTRPVFGGGYLSTLAISAEGSNVITMQRGSAPAGNPAAVRATQTVRVPMPLGASDTGIKVVSESKATFAQDITKADVLVAVGRGIGQQDRIEAYRELASVLGGSIAASRPLVDLGWLPVDFQVGLSGCTVRPKVYLACGISGSMQHLAGMRDSKLIIAINQDADAPIFQYAHYGVVADINVIVPVLIEQARDSASKNA